MNTIIRIYRRDIRRILKNSVLLIITAGLIIIPALYAWISINANWDPYGNTKNLLVAVVNNDKGTQIKNTHVNFGAEIIEKLRKNQSIGWTFVDQEEAKRGVQYGKYYASIIISEDFSSDLLSILTQDQPHKAKLIYSVNEKVNAITPKITKSGLTSLQNEIVTSFTQEVTNTVLLYLDAYGEEFKQFKDTMDNMLSQTGELESILPDMGKKINLASQLSSDIHHSVQNIQKSIPVMTNMLNQYTDMAKANNNYIARLNGQTKDISRVINTNLTNARDKTDNAVAGLKNINGTIITGVQVSGQDISDKLQDALTMLTNNVYVLKSINNVLSSNALSGFIDDQKGMITKLQQGVENLKLLTHEINLGQKISTDAVNDMIQSLENVSKLLNGAEKTFNNNISPVINNFSENLMATSDNSLLLFQNAKDNLPLMSSILQDTEIATGLGSTQLKKVSDRFPAVQQDLQNAISKVKNLNNNSRLNSLMDLLRKDPQAVSNFLSNPIELQQERIYPFPNYGSAMTPFYTTLALWVSAIVLLSLLSVKVDPFENGMEIQAKEQFFGRFLTFATIAIVQALVVSAGNLFLLKAYAVSPVIFLLFSVYTGIIFNMIVYTLVSILGNVGKALALIIMVLQVSASGGTFPVQLTPRFFQNISPMLPFTYAIGGMREAQGGIIWSILMKNAAMLSVFFFISMILAIFFKEKVNKIMEWFINKAKVSGLIGD